MVVRLACGYGPSDQWGGTGLAFDARVLILAAHDARIGPLAAGLDARGWTPDTARAVMRTNTTAIGAIMVHRGEADSMICGTFGQFNWHLGYVRQILARGGLHPVAALSLMILEDGPLFIADTHVHSEPTPQQIMETVIGAARHVRRFGITPKIALCTQSQFGNMDNPQAHYEGTGPEIWRQTHGSITHFVSSMGTTGTIMGTSRYLKEQNPAIEIIGLQPADGAQIPGIRCWPQEYLPTIFERQRVDEVIDIPQTEAETMMRRLAREEGIFCGVSSGGSVWAALELSKRVENAVIVAIVCDRGDRYLSTGVFTPVPA